MRRSSLVLVLSRSTPETLALLTLTIPRTRSMSESSRAICSDGLMPVKKRSSS
jgi:hypothetical protein